MIEVKSDPQEYWCNPSDLSYGNEVKGGSLVLVEYENLVFHAQSGTRSSKASGLPGRLGSYLDPSAQSRYSEDSRRLSHDPQETDIVTRGEETARPTK